MTRRVGASVRRRVAARGPLCASAAPGARGGRGGLQQRASRFHWLARSPSILRLLHEALNLARGERELQETHRPGRQSYFASSEVPAKGDDFVVLRRRWGRDGPAFCGPDRAGARRRAPAPAQPRWPRGPRPGRVDEHTLTVRRRIALGAAVVLLIVIVLVVNGCVRPENAGPEELQPRRRPDQPGSQRTGREAAVRDARERVRKTALEVEESRPAARHGAELHLAVQGPS